MLQDIRERARWLAQNVLPHEPLVRSRLSRIYLAGLDIDDVIQDMYARILSTPSLEAIRYPRQYAIQTARAIVIDHLRRSRVVSIVSGGTLEEIDMPLPESSIEERLQFQEEIQAVAGALAQLPAMWRETLILRRVEGLSQKETAQRLGITEKMAEHYMADGARTLVALLRRGGKAKAHSSAVVERTVLEGRPATTARDVMDDGKSKRGD